MENKIITSISQVGESLSKLRLTEKQLENEGSNWLKNISEKINDYSSEEDVKQAINELSPVIKSVFPITGSIPVNLFAGEALSLLMKLEWHPKLSKKITRNLLNGNIDKTVFAGEKRLLIFIPAFKSTKIACFVGYEKVHETEVHLSPDITDNIDSRVDSIVSWLSEVDFPLSSLDGIACRTGFFKPVPTGIYKIVPEMLYDLETPRIYHSLNMAIEIALKLLEISGRKDSILLTTRDSIVSDEIDTVERLTGFIKIKRDGTGAHYLNHKAMVKFLSYALGRPTADLNIITAHLGGGISIALHRRDKIGAVVDAFSGVPSPGRCGPLDLPRLINSLRTDEITLKELESVTFSKGGLLSLAGTDDFYALDDFRNKGASEAQRQKIDLIFSFFARQITSSIFKLTTDGEPVDFVALTGGLVKSGKLVENIKHNINGRYPLVLIPESLENEALAESLLTGFYEQAVLKDYVTERDALKEKRENEDALIDTALFQRKIIYRKKDAPILSLDELFDATCITVRDNFIPTIGIVGADNEEAILAAKRANEEGNYRIAKFKLIGDYAAINQIAYDFDLVIDNDNFTIVDTDNPIDEATKLLESGQVHLLMKGRLKTEDLSRGVFQYFKGTGKLKPGELISHIFVMDIPVRNKLLLITDAAVNTYPDEEKRIKILENALKVAFKLNIPKPKVAVISAIESVNQSIESSIIAQRIAERYSSRNDCIVEGPLSFDVAMDQHIAIEKHYKGAIKGTADIVLMPDIDAGNVLYKSLTTQSGATSAGVILIGNMPLVLTSRGDSARSKLASISLAVKMFFDL